MEDKTIADSTDPDRPGKARDERASKAAHDSVDTERLLPGEETSAEIYLPGENPTTSYKDDIHLWITVYSELLAFKRFMIDGASRRAGAMLTSEARQEIESTDLRVARAEAERFMGRLAFWRGRLESLPEEEEEEEAGSALVGTEG